MPLLLMGTPPRVVHSTQFLDESVVCPEEDVHAYHWPAETLELIINSERKEKDLHVGLKVASSRATLVS